MVALSLMVQGTTSDAGKSILVAGLCRVLKRRGIKVAPFKPQNMSLNSAVTIDGGEIGRAQALQAQACGLPCHTDMNPVLLKPCSDTGAQVIIHGHVLNNMNAKAYHHYKQIALDAVLASHRRLQQQYDVILVEGAGSPAEINLRDNDIANMGFAEAVDCPVIIIADIDRGGVFAHLVGTLNVLSESEQARISGFVINRFRGDIDLLTPGLDWLGQQTQKQVWGVIPYLNNLYLDAEDAVTVQQKKDVNIICNIAVLVFAHISNHTDFDALRLHPNIDLHFVAPGQALPNVDLVILPGSKNVRGDLAKLIDFGWDTAIRRHLRYGGKVIGICGGYQLLGETIADPEGIEGEPGDSQALGVLPITTALKPQKKLKQIQGSLLLHEASHGQISGYEIHCGQTYLPDQYTPLIKLNDGRYDGIISEDNLIIGTYVHGLFDQPQACKQLLSWAGASETEAIDLNSVREQQLDRLADCLEKSLSPAFFAKYFPQYKDKNAADSCGKNAFTTDYAK